MKTYRVYVLGVEKPPIKAASHNAAEKKAKEKYKDQVSNLWDISVEYTEV